ncbi:hypothetical protein PRZ48_008217 [Zasmidium cellare]|uniref:Uncharacterized protein n=1 Tax=Zasmidium cellare TaxID=395010 RepID=A0ABR0EFM0_ZASCE|nr:hypothetical protein PRZ48_008217 [Zasmidium cellare]
MAHNQPPSTGFDDVPHHIEHEEILTEDPASGHNDGYSMYRAIARMVIGDPTQYTVIRKAVLLFAMRVRAQQSHVLHHQYMAHEAAFRGRLGGKELFACLDCPDHIHPTYELCWVIAFALKVRINIYERICLVGTLPAATLSTGPDNMQVIELLTRKADPPMAVKYSALLLDESGKALVHYLSRARTFINCQSVFAAPERYYRGLEVKQMSWAWRKKRQNDREYDFTSFNEFRDSSRLRDLAPGKELDRMDTFVVVVNDPSHVDPALELFYDALLRAPNQNRTVKTSSDLKPGRMLSHCAADAEFIKVPTEPMDLGNGSKTEDQIADGKVEELCSVLTLAIGTQFSLVVNVLHMLQNANEKTVPALERLFTRTIFNTKLLKIWWNLQRDFIVLDNTIAHMYQGSVRKPFMHTPWPTGVSRWVTPQFRLQSRFLHGTRPESMQFPKGENACEIHDPSINELNMSCPCQLNNVDIAALLSHFARLHGFPRGMKAWTKTESQFNYGGLISTTLGDHRLLPLLQHLKDAAGSEPRDQAAFYQRLGRPGMEADDRAMGYVLMDTYALNIILDKFLAQDDPRKIAQALVRYGLRTSEIDIIPMSEPEPQRQSNFGDDGGRFGLFEDNPKRFKRDGFWAEYATAALSFWEHEERVNVNTTLVRSGEAVTSPPLFDELWWVDQMQWRRGLLLQRSMDPLSLWWPTSCAEVLPEVYQSPIIRAGTTHAEALIELLNSSICRGSSPPPGFGAALNSVQGLPTMVGRIPGSGLEHARAIFEAHQQKTRTGDELGDVVTLPKATSTSSSQEPDYEALVQEKITTLTNRWRGADYLVVVRWVRDVLSLKCATEDSHNKMFGRPGALDPEDLYDPEGREYRRRAEKTLPWNRPEHIGGLPADVPWTSENTEMLKALNSAYPQVVSIPVQYPRDITEYRPASPPTPRKRAGEQQQEEAAREYKSPRKMTKPKASSSSPPRSSKTSRRHPSRESA